MRNKQKLKENTHFLQENQNDVGQTSFNGEKRLKNQWLDLVFQYPLNIYATKLNENKCRRSSLKGNFLCSNLMWDTQYMQRFRQSNVLHARCFCEASWNK